MKNYVLTIIEKKNQKFVKPISSFKIFGFGVVMKKKYETTIVSYSLVIDLLQIQPVDGYSCNSIKQFDESKVDRENSKNSSLIVRYLNS